MEIYMNVCPLASISWLWLSVAVVVSFMVGWLWYGVIFRDKWLKAVRYECACGADVKNGEKCTCKHKSFLPMIVQILATILVAIMYFVLTRISIWLSVGVFIAVAGWMKAALMYQIPDLRRFFTRAVIDVGYFTVVSIICVLLALIH